MIFIERLLKALPKANLAIADFCPRYCDFIESKNAIMSNIAIYKGLK